MNKHKWHTIKHGNTYYAGRCVYIGKKKIHIKMHREVIHPPGHLVVDHINHNGLDNRKANIRPATCAQNNRNRLIIKREDSSSKYKGVTWQKATKKWMVRIGIHGKQKLVGYFKEEIHAAKAYDKAAKKYHKEFASLNFKE